MFLGKVIGTVWSTVKWPQVQGLKLLVVRPYHLADLTGSGGPQGPDARPSAAAANPGGGPDAEAVICVDLLDAGVGDDVVVAFGHAARVAAELRDSELGPGRGLPADARAHTLGREGSSSITAPLPATIPIDAAVVAVVDSIEVERPGT